MKTFWHLLKFNLVFNRISIAFLGFLALVIFGLCFYFFESRKEMGEYMMQYSFYVLFMIFTGKMNSRNNMMFDIKHLVALPLSNYQIIILKSFADSFQLLPIALTFLYGFSLAFPEHNILIITLIFYMLLSLGNIIAFNKRIDFSRMQHSKTSYKNSFLFLHKYLEMFLQIILVVGIVSSILLIFDKKIILIEYSFFLLMIIGLFVASMSSLKMLKDETRSYFILKRDSFRIGWKLIVVIVPLFLFHNIYKKQDVFKQFGLKQDPFTSELIKKVEKIDNFTDKRFLLSIIQNDQKAVDEYLAEPTTIPWTAELMGSYPPHLAALSGRMDILKKMQNVRPDIIHMQGKYKKKTPLFSALRKCQLDIAKYLIEKGSDIDAVDSDGNTPMIEAAKNGCYGGVVLLHQSGADIKIKNNDEKSIMAFLPKKSGLKYILSHQSKRNLASEQKAD
ncbi:MAG: ankyrin repeat domain-containing protein [Bacteriovoracaceae bacterium]|jgi:hypothetical protein|nr:hypothetical protein [Halobacteriovoraceae bacterium]MDP7321594.1 ankyrin repeat domain-containing protein [Bacteriovoracaceae bacterium]